MAVVFTEDVVNQAKRAQSPAVAAEPVENFEPTDTAAGEAEEPATLAPAEATEGSPTGAEKEAVDDGFRDPAARDEADDLVDLGLECVVVVPGYSSRVMSRRMLVTIKLVDLEALAERSLDER